MSLIRTLLPPPILEVMEATPLHGPIAQFNIVNTIGR
jgi:hypothetical protein